MRRFRKPGKKAEDDRLIAQGIGVHVPQVRHGCHDHR
jgi:hypothetical protein